MTGGWTVGGREGVGMERVCYARLVSGNKCLHNLDYCCSPPDMSKITIGKECLVVLSDLIIVKYSLILEPIYSYLVLGHNFVNASAVEFVLLLNDND